MAWNEDNWRLAAEAFNTSLESLQFAEQAAQTIAAQDMEMSDRLVRAGGQQGRNAMAAATRLNSFGGRLPETEPEARRAIQAAQRWKSDWNYLDGQLATAANQGRIITLPDRDAINRAGYTRTRERLVMVPWREVSRMMAVPMTAPRTPAVPRAPREPGTTTRRRAQGAGFWLPIIIIGALLFSPKK